MPLIVDNTFPTPINCRPFEYGVDIVTHSTTKYMDGHAMAVGGAIVDSGNFDWKAHADKFPGMTEPDDSYHGIVYAEKFGKAGYITKATAQVMRDLGSIPAPMNSFLLNVGLETLHLRMPKHCENALKVACEAPINIVRMCFDAIKLHKDLVDKGSRLAISDVGVGIQCLRSAILSGQQNVVININSIKDMEYVEKVRNEVNHLVEEGVKICDEVYAKVEKALGK